MKATVLTAIMLIYPSFAVIMDSIEHGGAPCQCFWGASKLAKV